jgi:hypothetical protein
VRERLRCLRMTIDRRRSRFPAGCQPGFELTQGLRPGPIYAAPPGRGCGDDWGAVLVEDQFSVWGSRFLGRFGRVGVAVLRHEIRASHFRAKDGAFRVFGGWSIQAVSLA